MGYDYEPPRNDVFGFLIFTFVGAVVGLTITKNSNFRNSLLYQYLTSLSIGFTTCLFPALICLRVAYKYDHSGSPETKKLLLAEGYASIGFFLLTFILGIIKYTSPLTQELNLTDLHLKIDEEWWMKGNLEEGHNVVAEIGASIDSGPYLRENKALWLCCIIWFTLRFLFLYIVFLPFAIGCNLYIAIAINPPEMNFNEIVFWISFGTSLLGVTFWLCTICIYQAYIHFVLIANSVIVCYFVADTPYTSNLLLGALTIYLSTTYDMINDEGVSKIYHILSSWWFQVTAFRHSSEPTQFPKSSHLRCSITWFSSETDPILTDEKRECILHLAQEAGRAAILSNWAEQCHVGSGPPSLEEYITTKSKAVLQDRGLIDTMEEITPMLNRGYRSVDLVREIDSAIEEALPANKQYVNSRILLFRRKSEVKIGLYIINDRISVRMKGILDDHCPCVRRRQSKQPVGKP